MRNILKCNDIGLHRNVQYAIQVYLKCDTRYLLSPSTYLHLWTFLRNDINYVRQNKKICEEKSEIQSILKVFEASRSGHQ